MTGLIIVLVLVIILVASVVYSIKAPYHCPRCGAPMKSEIDGKTDTEIYSCPKCGHTFKIIG